MAAPRAGKTSALLQLPRRLGGHRDGRPSLDLQDARFGAESAAGFLGALASAVREEAQRHNGLTLPPLDRAALAADPYPALGRWLDRLEAALSDRALLLCLDEFEALEEAIACGQQRASSRRSATLCSIAAA